MNTVFEMERIKEHQKLSWQSMFYSIQRIDLLIISICGAGIYLCIETMKFCYENKIEINLLLKGSGVIFLVGIVINFVSQIFSYKTNEQDYLMCEVILESEDNTSEEEQSQIDKYNGDSEWYSSLTMWFNYGSIAFMLLGLTFILAYFLTTF